MESCSGVEERVSQPVSSLVWRLRLAASSLVLIAVAMIQQPGRIIGDTKADLTLDPGGLLARGLHMWDPNGSFGQVQNQAYGYLFPMGPFFWIGDLIGIPDWVTQRLWWALILVVAFLGMVKLCSVLRIGTPTARIIGAFAFALSPRILSVIGPSSIEVWPSALAPWVLIPLVLGLRAGDPRRMAALSALAVACVGGVNAVATFAVIPLGALWLLCAEPSLRRRSMMIWWPAFVLLGTLWWLIPLFLLGTVSPPFLDFIESSSVTTYAATLFDALRGTTNWIPYLDEQSQGGNALLRNGAYALNSAVLIMLGLLGIISRNNPIRRFLFFGLVLGLLLVTLGHSGAGLGDATVRSLLDGVLSPLRNAHKFDPVIRVVLVIGLVHLVSIRLGSAAKRGWIPKHGLAVLACAAIVGSTVPAWTADLPNKGSYTSVPSYWSEASSWLTENAQQQNTLVLPGIAFGDFLWGSPRDEPIQALASTPWAVRNAVPLVPAGHIRALDGLDRLFASGIGSAGLAEHLRRSGIQFVLVRHDLDPYRQSPGPELVSSTLSTTPGVKRVASFGPQVGSPPSQQTESGETVFVNFGLQAEHRVVEIYELAGVDSAAATIQALDRTPVVAGEPGFLAKLGDTLDGSNAILAGDFAEGAIPPLWILTDSNRRKEAAFGRVGANHSASLGRNDRYRLDRPVHDYEMTGGDRWQTIPELHGVKSIRASSSRSDATAQSIDQSRQPWSAFDGERLTRWTAAPSAKRSSEWIEVIFDRPTSVDGMTVRLSRGQPDREFLLQTDAGSALTPVRSTRRSTLETPVGLTTKMRLSVKSDLEAVSIDEIHIPGVDMSRPLRLPKAPKSWGAPASIVMSMQPGPPRCLVVEKVRRCWPGRIGLGEDGTSLDRIFDTTTAQPYAVDMDLTPVDGPSLHRLARGALDVRASSTAADDPAAGVLTTTDGDPQTGWISAFSDTTPTIDLAWRKQRKINKIRLVTDPTLAASAPKSAQLTFADGTSRKVGFDLNGVARFAAVESDAVSIQINGAYVRSSLSFDGTGSGLPIGISEIELPESGIKPAADVDEPRKSTCGTGPTVAIDGRKYETELRTSRRAIISGASVSANICGSVRPTLNAGEHHVTARANRAFRPQSLRFRQGPTAVEAAETVPMSRTKDSIDIELPAGQGSWLVTVPQNVNPGWTVDNESTPVAVNGWMQGWITKEGGAVRASFGIDAAYRASLLSGAVTLIFLLGIALRRRAYDPVSKSHARPPRNWRAASGITAAVMASLVLGGLAATAIGLAVGTFTLAATRRWNMEWLSMLGILAAGIGYLLRPWGHAHTWAGDLAWPQLCVAVSLWAAGAVVFDEPIRTFLKRITGRSTTR